MTLPSPIESSPASIPIKKPSGLLWAGAILVVASSIAGIFCLVKVVSPTLDAINSPTMNVPGRKTFNLDAGTYTVYEKTGRSTSGFSINSGGLTSISPSDIKVTSPSGSSVSVRSAGYNETLDDGAVKFTGVGQFQATTVGPYTVDIESKASTDAKVGPSVASLGSKILGWVAGAAAAGVIFVIGAILLIVGFVRRSRTGRVRSSGFPGYGPPGYGPPGYGPPGYGPPGYGPPGYGPVPGPSPTPTIASQGPSGEAPSPGAVPGPAVPVPPGDPWA